MSRYNPKRVITFFAGVLIVLVILHRLNNGGSIKEYNEMSSDECMVPFRGWLSIKQYCKDKPVKFGVKVSGVITSSETRNGTPSAHLPNASTNNVDIKTFSIMLAKYASKEKWILLSLIDQGCRDMAINFYEDSLKKFGITNYLFIGADKKTCSEVKAMDINCYVYKLDNDAGSASVYLSKDFLRKMNIRTYLILDALNLGYSVLHSDVDITFTKNPFIDFDYLSDKYDVAPLWDCGAHNAGYLFIQNSEASKAVYRHSKHIADTEPRTDDQVALNRGIRSASKSHGLKLISLPHDKYLCGQAFFQTVKRDFVGDKPCEKCVVVHNNWIVSMEAKEYRMKEMHMWVYDVDKYYSDPNGKYIYFENPVKFSDPDKTLKAEIDSLMNALVIGEILNRIVIYPRFHYGKNFVPCTVIYHLLLRKLLSVYPKYRENTFLQHPKVPKNISEGKSKFYFVSSGNSDAKDMKLSDTVSVLNPKDLTKGATDEEIKSWFGNNKEPVLRFHSLYNAFCCYSDPKQNEDYQKKLKTAVKPGKYLQM